MRCIHVLWMFTVAAPLVAARDSMPGRKRPVVQGTAAWFGHTP